MPTYQAECEICHKVHEYSCSIDERFDTPSCCGKRTSKVIFTAPAVYGDLDDFSTENGGKGRFNKQLNEHVTSVDDAIQKAAKRGYTVLDRA